MYNEMNNNFEVENDPWKDIDMEDYRIMTDVNRWCRLLKANEDEFKCVVNELADLGNTTYEDAFYALIMEMGRDEIDGTLLTDDHMEDFRLVNGYENKTYRIFSRFSFMVEYKDRVLERLAE